MISELRINVINHTILSYFQAESPPYWSIEQWCKGFRDLLSHLHFEKVILILPILQSLTYLGLAINIHQNLTILRYFICLGSHIWISSWRLSRSKICRIHPSMSTSSIIDIMQHFHRFLSLQILRSSSDVSYFLRKFGRTIL